MRMLLALISLSAAQIMPSAAAQSIPGPDQVTVRRLSQALPADKEQALQFLWDSFANKPEETMFSPYGVKDWRANYAAFAAALVKKAAEQKLEHAELKKILDTMLKDNGLALLPVGAYRTTQGSRDIWIVVCKWEGANIQDAELCLGHINMTAFDLKTLRPVVFQTCM